MKSNGINTAINDTQRDDRKTDLPRAFQGRVQGRFPLLEVAKDILNHHNGVIYDEAGRDRECHQS
jgi:hypothetical protein